MGGGLMQLVAYGAQDVYLTGNPQITFFKVVYRRHTNFAVEPIQQTWNGNADFGRTVTCTINRNGDLITHMYVVISLNQVALPTGTDSNGNTVFTDPAWGYVSRLGHAVCDDVKIEIGGSNIDEQYSDWLNIWYELTHKTGQERGYAKMIGDVPLLTNVNTNTKPNYLMYVPLQFWFNRNNGLALPLIALQYHDVRITLIFKKAQDCINWSGPSNKPPSMLPNMTDSYLLIDYVYLDSEERKRFAQASHEYLIEQLQFTGSESLSSTAPKYRLNFNHPCKYLVWVPHFDRYLLRQEWLSYAFDGDWSSASDRFAKLLYTATRAYLSATPPVHGTGSNAVVQSGVTLNSVPGLPFDLTVNRNYSSLWVATGASYSPSITNGMVNAAGDLFEAPVVSGLTPTLLNLLSKIQVRFVCQADPQSETDVTAQVVNASSPADVINQLLVNTIVVQNNLTMEDISRPFNSADFAVLFNSTNGVPTSTSVNTLLTLAKLSVVNYCNYGNFIDGSDNPVYSGKLQLNGHDRFQARDGFYFNYVQPFQHFSNTPSDGVNVYSFALKPEDHQPTGSCNFSRIDNATLQLFLGKYNQVPSSADNYDIGTSSLLNIFTVNYNVLRVMSGMAGAAYSN